MQRLDPSFLANSPDVGKVTPTGWRGDNDEFDRGAHYHYGGKFFDAHGLEIVPGRKPKKAAAPPPPPPVEEGPDDEDDDAVEAAAPATPPVAQTASAPLSPGELGAMADRMPFAKFATEAKRILGPTCPKSKQAIVAALQEAIAGYEKRYGPATGLSWGSATQQPPKAPKGPPPAPPVETPNVQTKVNGVLSEDQLKSWARGRQEYLWAEIHKAIRTHYGKQIAGEHARKDAVDFLIEQRVITAAEARKDV